MNRVKTVFAVIGVVAVSMSCLFAAYVVYVEIDRKRHPGPLTDVLDYR